MIRPHEIIAEPPFPWMALLWAALAILLLTAGVLQGNPHLCLAAAPFVALSLGLILFRPPHIAGRLDEAALVLTNPQITIPYSAIESITLAGKPQDAEGKLKSGPIGLFHCAGALAIPPQLNRPVEDVYRDLLAKTETSGSREVPVRLQEFYAKEVEAFGEGRVWSFRARRQLFDAPANRRRKACFAFLLIAGIVWVVASVMLHQPGRDDYIGWGIGGGWLIVVGLLGAVVSSSQNRRLAKQLPRWQDSGIVIAPSGIGMVQGDVQGQLRWDELREVRMGRPPRSFGLEVSAGLTGGLELIVAGASVRVCDIYDRPLPVIAKFIRQCWGRPGA